MKAKRIFLIAAIGLIVSAALLINIAQSATREGKVELPKEPRVQHKSFLVIHYNKIGFGPNGVTLGGKYYSQGTVFEILSQDAQTITIRQEGQEATYPKRSFSGGYGSGGTITTVKWDVANNRLTGLDLPDEYHKKYYHFAILLIYNHFWLVAILLGLGLGFAYLVEEGAKMKAGAVIVGLFLIVGYMQGSYFQEYLDKMDQIAQGAKALKMRASFGGPTWAGLKIETSGTYDFFNVVFVPLFLVFHYVVLKFIFLVFVFVNYLFVSHPAEQYIDDVQKGKISAKTGLTRVVESMYSSKRDGLPFKWQSDNTRKRVEALTGRIRAEESFMQEIIKFIKAKSRFE